MGQRFHVIFLAVTCLGLCISQYSNAEKCIKKDNYVDSSWLCDGDAMVLNIADVHGNGIICNQRIARANVMELEAPKVTLPDADHVSSLNKEKKTGNGCRPTLRHWH